MRVFVAAFLVLFPAAPLRAQDTAQVVPPDSVQQSLARPYRSPHKALILGTILPGAGYMYTGEYLRGYGTWVATIGLIGEGVMVYILDNCTFTFLSTEKCKPEPAWPHQLLGIAGIGGGLWTWITSARDAPHAAERANERHRSKKPKVEPLIGLPTGTGPEWKAGLAVRWDLRP